MKIQDIGFFIILLFLFAIRKPILFVWTGLGMLVFSIPLFSMHIFFTAERLTWYAAFCFLLFILFSFVPSHKVK